MFTDAWLTSSQAVESSPVIYADGQTTKRFAGRLDRVQRFWHNAKGGTFGNMYAIGF